MVSELAKAKINLYLDVTGKRGDGYHEIVSIMQSVTLADTVEIDAAGELRVLCDDAEVPSGPENLAWRAAECFFRQTGIAGGADIMIRKRIPVAAGLAGGSSDAAAVLRGLNRLYGTGLSTEQLCKIGAGLGADIPFCIVGGTMLTEGIGDRMTPVGAMPDCFLVIAKDGPGISTRTAYARLDTAYGDFSGRNPNRVTRVVSGLTAGDLVCMAEGMMNIFESVLTDENQATLRVIEDLRNNGAIAAMMSGSGPSVFGVFRAGKTALLAAQHLTARGIRAQVCRPE